jgi:hypothetical protein
MFNTAHEPITAKETQTVCQLGREANRWLGRQTVQQTDRKVYIVEQDSQTNKQTEGWAERQTLE